METNLNQVFEKEEEIFNEISKLKKDIKQNNIFKIIKFIIIIFLIVFSVYAGLKIFMEYEKVNEYNNRLILLLDNKGYKEQIKKDLKELINNVEIVSKLEGMSWNDYTDDEIDKLSVEFLIGEIFYKINYKKVMAYISAESFWNKKARSKKDARGLMQLLISTYYECLDDLAEEKERKI